MLFGKKESDANYAMLKQQVMDEFQKLQNGNPFENPHTLRDKWSIEYENAKNIHKLSKKYSDTVGDVEMLKSLREQSKERLQFFTHAAEALDYKNDVFTLKCKFENFEEMMLSGETISDIIRWHQEWKSIYEEVEGLYRKKNQFVNDEYDKEGLDSMHYGTMYYYGLYTYQLIYETQYNNLRSEVIRKQNCLKEALKITSHFSGCDDEFKFKLLRGRIYFEQGKLCVEYADVFGTDKDSATSNLVYERNRAYQELKVLEEDDGKNITAIVMKPVEWYIYKGAVNNLYSYLLYNKKNINRAHDYLEKEISKHEFDISIGIERPEFVERLKSELALFQKGMFGWKYLG